MYQLFAVNGLAAVLFADDTVAIWHSAVCYVFWGVSEPHRPISRICFDMACPLQNLNVHELGTIVLLAATESTIAHQFFFHGIRSESIPKLRKLQIRW